MNKGGDNIDDRLLLEKARLEYLDNGKSVLKTRTLRLMLLLFIGTSINYCAQYSVNPYGERDAENIISGYGVVFITIL